MEGGFKDLMEMIMGGGGAMQAQFTKAKSQFELDKKNRIKRDPVTGKLIEPKDRRKLGKFLQNPFLVMPGSALNMNVPMAPTMGSGMGALADLTKGVVK